MKNVFKRTLTLIISAVLFIGCTVLTAYADGTTLSFSNNKPKINDAVTVTVTVSASESMYAMEFMLNYNQDVLRFDGGENATGGAGAVKVVCALSGKTRQSCSLNFTAIAAGSCTVQVTDVQYAGTSEKRPGGASAALVVADAAKSDNANLKSLSLSKGSLSPRFSTNKTSYTATVAYDVTECRIYATAADGGAKIAVEGENALKVGKNTRKITVTAASGAQKVYTVTITRQEENAAAASSEPESSEPQTAPANETTVGGVNYTVATDISSVSLPNGFTAERADFNGTEVAVARDKNDNYTVYYLKSADSDAYTPYTLEKSTNKFKKLEFAVFGSNTYIFADAPKNMKAPDGYYETNTKIGEFNVSAYAKTGDDNSDFYYIYCFFDSGFGTYRYDVKEGTFQRCPEFAFVLADEIETKPGGLMARFSALSTNAKIVVLGFLIALIVVIALIVAVVINFVKAKKNYEYEDYGDEIDMNVGFDSVTETDANDPGTTEDDTAEPLENENETESKAEH